jgi:hypothetical protein
MIALYGAKPLYETILSALVREIEVSTHALDVRACIMLPTDRRSLMVIYEVGFENAADSDLELSENEGAAWKVWESNKIIPVNLDKIRSEPDRYNMTKGKINLIPSDRKSLICAPILCGSISDATSNEHSFGVMCIDCATQYSGSAWLDSSDERLPMTDIIMGWSAVIGRVIQSSMV